MHQYLGDSCLLWTNACAPGLGQWRGPSGDINPLFGTVDKFGSLTAAGYAVELLGALGCLLE